MVDPFNRDALITLPSHPVINIPVAAKSATGDSVQNATCNRANPSPASSGPAVSDELQIG